MGSFWSNFFQKFAGVPQRSTGLGWGPSGLVPSAVRTRPSACPNSIWSIEVRGTFTFSRRFSWGFLSLDKRSFYTVDQQTGYCSQYPLGFLQHHYVCNEKYVLETNYKIQLKKHDSISKNGGPDNRFQIGCLNTRSVVKPRNTDELFSPASREKI